MLLQEILFEGLYYVLIYITLFISFFWFVVFFEKREDLSKDPPGPKRTPGITMIIPAYNEEKGIAATIDSVLNQDYPKGKLKIIVVDDASSDRTAEIIREYGKKEKGRCPQYRAQVRGHRTRWLPGWRFGAGQRSPA